MRCALVGLTHPFRGGIAHYTTLLCQAMRERHEVRFFALSRQYPSLLFPGKTQLDDSADALQVDRHLERFNQENPGHQVFIIRYDDFNPFLDHFSERMGRRTIKKPERVLDNWKLWDHMDAILCLGVTKLCPELDFRCPCSFWNR